MIHLLRRRFGDGGCAATTIERASCSATLTWRRGCGGIIRCERSGRSRTRRFRRWSASLPGSMRRVDDAVWDHSVFSKNRDRLLEGDIAAKFLTAVLAQPK